MHVKKSIVILYVAIILIAAIYIPTIPYPFISDDTTLPTTLTHLNPHTILRKPYQSLRSVLYVTSYRLFGPSPVAFRPMNILFHAATTVLVFALISLLISPMAAATTTLLFAVHPVLAESITWISGGVYIQYSLLLLTSFLLYLKRTTNTWFYPLSIVVFLLAHLSSEKAIIGVLILLWYEIVYGSIQKQWRLLLPYGLIALCFFILLVTFVPDRITSAVNSSSSQPPTQVYNIAATIPIAVTAYLGLFIFPKTLTLFHTEIIPTKQQLFLLIGITATLVMAIWKNRRDKHLIFWSGWFFIALLPTLTPFVIAWVVAERYAYLASIGFFALVGYAVATFQKNHPRIVSVALLLVLVVLTLRTIKRNQDWSSPFSFWKATVHTSPSYPNAHMVLGVLYGQKNKLRESAQELQTAIALAPDYTEAYYNLGITQKRLKKTADAKESFERAHSLNPHFWLTTHELVILALQTKDWQKAEQLLSLALMDEPNNVDIRIDQTVFFVATGKKELAIAAANRIRELSPNHPKLKDLLSLVETGRDESF